MNDRILLVFRAINHRTLKARNSEKCDDRITRDRFRSMNICAIQVLFALNIIDGSQYNDLYEKIWRFETININDINNLL